MSAAQYTSVTRSTRIIDVPTAIRNAVVTHAEHNKLQLVEAQTWVTLRTKLPTKSVLRTMLRRPAPAAPIREMVLVVHATHFIVGGSRGVVADAIAMSVPLTSASIGPVGHGEGEDGRGFTIHGFSGPTSTFFMGLGAGADADACVAAVKKAIADAPATAKASADAKEVIADAKAATKAADAKAADAKAATKAANATSTTK